MADLYQSMSGEGRCYSDGRWWLLKPDADLVVTSVSPVNGTRMIGIARFSTAVATLSLLVATVNFAEAGSRPKERSKETITTRTAGEPIMAIVSLRSQRITIYDADGWIMRAPVS